MIDESALFQELKRLQKPLFSDYKEQAKLLQQLWQHAITNNLTCESLRKADKLEVRWDGVLGTKYKHVRDLCMSYQVVAVDGSQIYPDRHEGISVALINIGGIWLLYNQNSCAQFFCQPYIFFETHETDASTSALVDAQRHAQELALGVEKAASYAQGLSGPLIVLFDGSLIFWHLENNTSLRERYFETCCAYVQKLCDCGVLCAWYISLPKSRDLVRVLNTYAVTICQDIPCMKNCSDGDILESWLDAGECTGVFESMGVYAQKYPSRIRPYFFYINSGAEIARIEIPACLAQQEDVVNTIAAIIIDQCAKGDGYPLALAEAHEQAVVKHQDRLLFQKLVYYFADQNHVLKPLSRKLIKKRSLAL